MKQFVLYHNPRCSKSRQMLAYLEENSLSFDIREYLKQPLILAELKSLRQQLDCPVRELIRKTEVEYKEAGLNDTTLSDSQLLQAIAQHPKLMQRPIVSNGKKAIIGRPLENIEVLL